MCYNKEGGTVFPRSRRRKIGEVKQKSKKMRKPVAEFRRWLIRRGRPKQGDQRSELTVASDNITRGYFFPLKLEFFARFGFNWLGKTGMRVL